MKIININSLEVVLKRQWSALLAKASSPTMKNLLGYMSLTYSITGLIVILGLFGKHTMAAEIAIVQGAALATFYVFSGDARHLILNDQVDAKNVVFFRLVWVIPLAILAYFMSTIASEVEVVIAFSLILRRCTEWLVEPHVTEIERINEKWPGWYIQPMIFALLVCQIFYTNQLWIVWIWAVSPMIFSLKFISQAKPYGFYNFAWENITSTAIIGFTGYIQRVLIVSLVGKEFSGMLFPGFSIGSFVGTMAANVVGPTAIRKGLSNSTYFNIGLIIWSLLGGLIFIMSSTTVYMTIGLSIVGGAIMVIAQQSRLSLLKVNHTLEADLLFHLFLIFSIPTIFYMGGMQQLSAFYLVGAILAWVFYKGSKLATEFNYIWRNRFLVLIVLGLIFPVFFQLSGNVYNSKTLAMIDSGGGMNIVPLPLSLFVCYLGVVLFTTEYRQSKPVVLTIAAMFLMLITSTILLNQGLAKIILFLQYIVPSVALLLGIALGDLNRKLIARVILCFLIAFIPLQLLITWFQGQLALTHYMYSFSVYQHYQYVPLVMVGFYLWVWVELFETHSKWILFLAPWMAMYAAAGNSIIALFGLLGFSIVFSISLRKRKFYLLIPMIMIASVGSYFYLNSQLAKDIAIKNHNNGLVRHGIFVDKLFNKDGEWLYTPNKLSSINKLPVNVRDRENFASIYMQGITESPYNMFVGHSSPPSRQVATSAHNYYLDLAYNFGIIACLPLLALLIYTVMYYRKNKNQDNSLVWLLMIVLYFVVIDNNLKVTLRQPYPGIIAFFLWGVLLASFNSKSNNNSQVT